ncbi:MAG: alpha/beta hydrolase domain-containing protein [Acidimicrobiales bacterium]
MAMPDASSPAPRWVALAGLLSLALAPAHASTFAGPASAEELLPVPQPEVEGPIPGSPPGDPLSDVLEETYPFFGSDLDLEARGYVEEEFFIGGDANVYADGEVVSTHPYETRVVVRRPAKPQRFSGTAFVEWQNVTAGFDLDALWSASADHYIRSGYAWVGVSAQNVGVSQLSQWSPRRYGDLDVTDGGTVTGDALSFDIFSQAALAVRNNTGDIMGGLQVEQALAIGASQSAGFMTRYYNDVLPLVEPVFDGYGYIVGNAPAPAEGRTEPIFQVSSETDVIIGLGSAGRGFEQTELFRRWEVAGTGHSGAAGERARAGVLERDLGPPGPDGCLFGRNGMPLHHVIHAAYDHLVDWADGGAAPPVADLIETDAGGAIVRDELGLAQGGIRLSQIDVPTAVNHGFNAADPNAEQSSQFCFLFGSHIPADETPVPAFGVGELDLDRLYRSHGAYVAAVNRVEKRNVRDGFVVLADSLQNRREAAQSDIGR